MPLIIQDANTAEMGYLGNEDAGLADETPVAAK